MHSLPENTIQEFASEFASGRKGFSLSEITDYFREYQPNIPTTNSTLGSTKPMYFHECVQGLTPTDQRLALLDLCNNPPSSMHKMPDENTRFRLQQLLFQVHGRSPVSASFSRVNLRGVREAWWKIGSRISANPDSAITAARTLLETTCKTIIDEVGEKPDQSGDLARLVKQAIRALDIAGTSSDQSIRQLLSGLNSTISGVAGISNAAGDRHGTSGGQSIKDVYLAELVSHAAGSIAVFLVQKHLLNQIEGNEDEA